MKNLILSVSLLVSGLTFSQDLLENGIERNKWCGTSFLMNELRADPQNATVFEQDRLAHEAVRGSNAEAKSATLRIIPIVFHILHDDGPENVSEEQILNALDVINRDFRLLNADTSSIAAQFQPLLQDADIEFRLATKAPDGTCFRGWTRTKSATTFSGGGFQAGGAQVSAIVSGNDIYNGQWPCTFLARGEKNRTWSEI